MIPRFLLFTAMFACFCTSVSAAPIVADLSNYRINIDARFIGTRLFLFGSRNENGDVVVVIRGPERKFTVRRKERVLGIWINRKYVSFAPAPDFYAVASSRPLDALTHSNLQQTLGIGEDTLLEVERVASRKLDVDEFKNALLDYQKRRRLYRDASKLQFMGDSLFKATFEFPDTISRGDYTAEIYLLQNDQLIGMQSIPITVRKTGFDGAVSSLARDAPWLYGIIAISLALGSGWLANRLFQKV
jgi:uncharacterized protein (TIGR02186 family)